MKNFTYSLLPALFSFLFFSTNPNPTDINLQPNADEEICLQAEEGANTEEEIKTFSLFKVSQNKGAKSDHLTGGVFLDLSPKDLSVLYSERPKEINFRLPTEETILELNLHEQQILTDDFVAVVMTENGEKTFDYKPGMYYVGKVADDPNSLVTISIFESKVMGIISIGNTNYNLGPMDQFSTDPEIPYVMFKERDLKTPPNIQCHVENSTPANKLGDLTGDIQYANKQANVVKVYIECDDDMYKKNGNSEQNTMDYTTALFNEVAKLYANEQILTRIKKIKVWGGQYGPDPYPSSTSNAALSAFRSQVGGTFDGDLAHLISTASGNNGGLASLDVLCFKSRGHAYSNISTSFSPIPTYSWSVEVFTHEMGHNLGCPHTQSCSWGPSNNQALDDCYATEGSCGPGPTPTNGGTIMSYCHLKRSVGINFNNGFGIEPGNLIRRKVALASCLEEVFDCFSKIELEPGVTYKGDSRNGGATDFDDYACTNISHKGNEIAHVFKPEVSGWAYITYTENIPDQMNLMLVPNCLPDKCEKFWEGAPLVRDSFFAIGGEEYTFITDVVEGSTGGPYTLRISFPAAACQTGNILEEGIIFTGDSKDNGTANNISYGCNSTQYLGNEVGHSFTPTADGQAYLYYSENLPEQMDLILLSACDATQCVKTWVGAPNVRDSFNVVAGQTYFFFTDTKEDSEGGKYDILISFPGSGCATTVSLANGVTHSGNTSEGSANFISYSCSLPAQTGSEVGHYFVSASDGKARLQFNGSGLTLIQANACNPDNCYKTYSGGSIDEEIDIVGLESYYFIVDGASAGSLPYDITITMQPQGNDCDCDDPLNDICESFDNYDLGAISPQSVCFVSGSSDGNIVEPNDPFGVANSGLNSMRITNNESTVLSLGNRSFGSYILKFAFRVDPGVNAYFKFYHIYDEANPANNEEAFDATMIYEPSAGIVFGRLYQGDPNPGTTSGTFGPLPIWKEFVFDIDLDKDSISMVYAGSVVNKWKFSNTRFGQNGQPIIGAIEFYSDGTNTDYLVDDFRFYSNEEGFCENSGGIYCEDFDSYRDDIALWQRNNPDEWLLNDTTATSPLAGSALASTFNSVSGAVSMEVNAGALGAPFDDIVCYPFGQAINPTGKLKQSMNLYIPNGNLANLRTFHSFSLDSNPANDIVGSSIHFGQDGVGEVISGGGSFIFAYTNNVWLDYVQLIDFDNDIATIFIQGVAVATFPFSNTVTGSGSNSDWAAMGFNCIDGQSGRSSRVRFFVDNIELIDQSLFLNIDPEALFVDSPAGSDVTEVTSNLPAGWTAISEDPSWLSISSGSTGNGNGTVNVNWTENLEITNRVGRIKVKGSGATPKTLTVTQIGAEPILIVDPDGTVAADPNGETLSFTVTANVRWGVNSNSNPWIIIPPDTGNDGSGPFTVNIARNLGAARSDTLFVEGDPAAHVPIIITQAEGAKYVGVVNDTICVQAMEGTVDFEVEANTAWSIDNTSGWFTTSTTSGSTSETITIDYQTNPLADIRYYDMVVSSPDVPSFTVVVKQMPEAPFMTADPLIIPVGVPAGMVNFSINSNVSWTLTENASWFDLSTTTGSSDGMVTINYMQNGDPFDRSDTIFIKGSNGVADVAIVVRQDGAGNLLSASPITIDVGSPAGDTLIQVLSNITWKARTTDLWLSLNDMGMAPLDVTGDADLKISYEQNNTTSARTGTITLTGPGVAAITITVNQAGGASVLCLDPETLEVESPAGNFDFDVISSLSSWNISSDVAWLQLNRSIGGGNSIVTASYSQHTGSLPRTAIITLTGPGMPEKTLIVTQNGQGFIFEVDKDTICVDEALQIANLSITTSNLSWNVSDDQTWIVIPPPSASGFGNKTIDVQIVNNTGTTRYGNVTVSIMNGPSKVVVVKQTGTAPSPILTLGQSDFTVDAAVGTESVDVTSNKDWTAVSNDSWITVTGGASGSNNGIIDFEFTENTDLTNRTGTITVSAPGCPDQTITIEQLGASGILSVNQDSFLLSAPAVIRDLLISSNKNWTLTPNNNWITVDPTSGSGDATASISFTENTDQLPRMGSLVLSAPGCQDVIISVIQAGAGCNLAVLEDDFNVDATQGSVTVDVVSNSGWVLSTTDSWITLPTQSGSGVDAVSINFGTNTDLTPRTGTVTITAAGCPTVTITIMQAGADGILSVDQTITVNAPMGSETVEVTSNKTWTVVSNDSWMTVSPDMGSNNGTFEIDYDENTTTATRSGTLTVSAAGCPDVIITVNQSGAGVIFMVDENSFEVDAPGGTETVVLTSNLDWTVKTSDAWISVDPTMGSGDATITITYTDNNTFDTRDGTVTICSAGQPDQVISIKQFGLTPTLTVDKDDIQLGQPADSETVTITSNTDWTVKTTATWITLDPTSGTGDATFTIDYTENTDLAERTATVTVCATGLPDQVIDITQSGRQGNLVVNPTILSLDAAASMATFNIMADVDWTIKTTENWILFNPSSGSGDETITVSVTENTDVNQRVGIITVCAAGLSDRIVTITQAGAVAGQLTVTPDIFNLPAAPGGMRSIDVKSNLTWQTTKVGGWVTIVSGADGTGDGTLEFTFPENTGAASRSATITFSAPGVPDQDVEINQAGVNFNLSVNPTRILLPASAGSDDFNIMSNVDWMISDNSAGNWITSYSDATGNGNANITFDYEENTDLTSRIAIITIEGVGVPSRTIEVEQAGRNALLDATPMTINVDADAGMEDFDIMANIAWTISASAGWVNNFDPFMGAGDGTVNFAYDENTTGGSRSAIITISGGGLTKDITVNQAAPDFFLDADPMVINLTSPAGMEAFKVISNIAWDISIPASASSWITPIDALTGSNTSDFNFSYTENTDANVRTALVTISGNGVASKNIEINQQGTIPLFLDVTPTDVTKTSVPGNQIFTVTSNTEWQACTNDPWITLTPETGNDDGFFVASFSTNPTANDRVGTVIVKSPGLPDQTITITQSGFTPELDANPKDNLVGSFQGTINIDVTSNVVWSVTSNATWANLVTSFGMNDETVIINYGTNPSPSPRIAILTFTSPIGGVAPVEVMITQSETNSVAELQKLYELNLFPNPVGEDLNIDFQLLRGEDLTIDILDIRGKQLDVISDDFFGANQHRISHNVNTLAPGVYLLRFKSEVGVLTKRFVVN